MDFFPSQEDFLDFTHEITETIEKNVSLSHNLQFGQTPSEVVDYSVAGSDDLEFSQAPSAEVFTEVDQDNDLEFSQTISEVAELAVSVSHNLEFAHAPGKNFCVGVIHSLQFGQDKAENTEFSELVCEPVDYVPVVSDLQFSQVIVVEKDFGLNVIHNLNFSQSMDHEDCALEFSHQIDVVKLLAGEIAVSVVHNLEFGDEQRRAYTVELESDLLFTDGIIVLYTEPIDTAFTPPSGGFKLPPLIHPL